MKDQIIYLPILKGKQGEYGALKELKCEHKKKILPLVEIPPITLAINDKPIKTINKIDSSIKNILNSWNEDQEIMKDIYNLEVKIGNDLTINIFNNKLSDKNYKMVPVIRLDTSEEILSNIQNYENICLRIFFKNFEDFKDINDEINRIKMHINNNYNKIYLLIDMGYFDCKHFSLAYISTISIINSINNIDKFKSLFLSITSFPINLSDCFPNRITKIERIETKLHQKLQENINIKRIPLYSDYCISNPLISEINPLMMNMSASIRYTKESYWYIFKGKSLKTHTFDQFYDLAKQIVKSDIYEGKDFSWGDKQINDKSKKIGSTGNASTWRKIGTNHHIIFMINLLSNYSFVSNIV